MIVAKQKIKTNIGEYLLYMFQIEDLIRACNFNKAIIESKLVTQYNTDDTTKTEIKDWYFGLSDLMEEEKLKEKGHLSIITNKTNEVFEFHMYLMQNNKHLAYQTQYKSIIPIINDLKQKQEQGLNDVDIILNTIYGLYLLKLKKQNISKETLSSVGKLSVFMAELSKIFKEYEDGELKME